MPPKQIEKTIYNTIAYFAYNQYPLTVFEIFKYQYQPEQVYSYEEIKNCLETCKWLKVRVGSCEGMYGIGTDREVEDQVATRKRNFLQAVKKQKKAFRIVNYLSRIPSIKGVAISNSLAYHFTRSKSDIDFFVIAKGGRLWTARMWGVLPLMVLRQRPGEAKKDPVDISFFVSDHALDLSSLKIDNDDPHFAYWIKMLVPVYGSEKLWDEFFRHNAWIDSDLPNLHRPRLAYRMRNKNKFSFLLNIFPEKFLRFLQLLKMPKKLKELNCKDTCVVMNEKVLKFHTTDRRAEIARLFHRAKI